MTRNNKVSLATVTAFSGISGFANTAAAAKDAGSKAPAPAASGNGTPATAGNTTAPAAKPEKQVLGISTAVALPTTTKRGNRSKYPFDQLPAPVEGQNPPSFGIKGMTAKNMTSVIHNANKNASEHAKDEAGNPLFKMTDMKDANGNVVGQTQAKDKKGKPIPVLRSLKEFRAIDVDPATDPEGASVRVFRLK